MGLSRAQWGSVGSFAVRIVRFAGCVADAHRLGDGPGEYRKPWGIGFQRCACLVYAQTLRAEYLRGVADASAYCAELMDGVEPEDEVAADWRIVAEFLGSTSQALGEMPEVADVASGVGVAEIGSAPPAVLRYELFAELLDSRGVVRLGDAAAAVVRCCELHVQVVPTAQELEWIVSGAAQVPIEELAESATSSLHGACTVASRSCGSALAWPTRFRELRSRCSGAGSGLHRRMIEVPVQKAAGTSRLRLLCRQHH